MTSLRTAAGALFLPALLAAQATQQAKGTWQRSDSSYKLGVDSTYKTDRSTIYLLDEAVIRFDADGRGSRTYHQIIQVIRQAAVEGMAERAVGWMPDRQTMRVNWVKVLKPTGDVISEEPAQSQDSDVPAAISNPVYGNTRVRRMSLSGLAPFTILDISFTIDDTAAYPPKDQFEKWWISAGTEVKRSRLLIDAPQAMPLTLVERNLTFKRAERTANGRHMYEWAAVDVPYNRPELYAADSNTIDMLVVASLPRPWKDVGNWYAGLSNDRYTLGDAARAKVKTAVANARTRDDSVRAVHRLIAHDVRYVSVSLGIGGYQPRRPDTVAVTGFGDCKDKATFFVAVLRDWGMKAHPVLLSAGGPTETKLASARQFDHAIAAVETANGYQFVDLTASTVPYGSVPALIQGQFAIVVRSDGRVDEVRIPTDPIGRTTSKISIVGELTPEGIFSGRYDQTNTGTLADAMRASFESPIDSTRRANLLRSLANGVYQGATGDSLVAFDGNDYNAVAHLGLVVRGGKAGNKSGSTMILNLNLGGYSSMLSTIDRLQSQGARRYPIDAARILSSTSRETEFRVTLPVGWKAQLPTGITAVGPFGEIRTEYSQVGRELIVRRRSVGTKGTYAPEKLADLIAWMKTAAEDDVKFIVITTAGQ